MIGMGARYCNEQIAFECSKTATLPWGKDKRARFGMVRSLDLGLTLLVGTNLLMHMQKKEGAFDTWFPWVPNCIPRGSHI